MLSLTQSRTPVGSGRSVLARARPDEEYHRSGPCLVRRRLGAARAAIRRLPRPSGKDCPMRALLFTAYGGPEVLEWADAPAPHPGPGRIRITVRAASVNPIDWKTFTGAMAGGVVAQVADTDLGLAAGHGAGEGLPVDRVHAGRPYCDPDLPRAGVWRRSVGPLEDLGTSVRREQQRSHWTCLLYTSPSPRDRTRSRMPSSA